MKTVLAMVLRNAIIALISSGEQGTRGQHNSFWNDLGFIS
jgi:hypothetical protein